jgi:hypothetical protein
MTRTIVYDSLAVFAVGYWLRATEFGGGKPGAATAFVVATASKPELHGLPATPT